MFLRFSILSHYNEERLEGFRRNNYHSCHYLYCQTKRRKTIPYLGEACRIEINPSELAKMNWAYYRSEMYVIKIHIALFNGQFEAIAIILVTRCTFAIVAFWIRKYTVTSAIHYTSVASTHMSQWVPQDSSQCPTNSWSSSTLGLQHSLPKWVQHA